MRVLGLITIALAVACAGEPESVRPSAHPAPPPQVEAPMSRRVLEVPTRTVDVVDDYFGEKVRDPYRWLEDSDSPEVRAWTEQQNLATTRYVDAIPGRAELAERIKDLLHVGLVSAPLVSERHAGHRRYFHTKREGSEDQPILYVREGVSEPDRVLIDPAVLSSDATTALDWWYPSN